MKRIIPLISISLISFIYLIGCSTAVPSHRPYSQIPIQWTVQHNCLVYANRQWQDSTVELQSGDKFFLDAKGRWSGGAGWESGPSGAVGIDVGRIFPEERAATALIGRVGMGSPFTIGDQYLGSATYSGNLFMRMNDPTIGDNSGFLNVDIYVQRKTITAKEKISETLSIKTPEENIIPEKSVEMIFSLPSKTRIGL